MWANTMPDGGLIVVGMSDAGEFLGCHQLTGEQLNKIEKAFITFCSDARVESRRIFVRAKDGTDSFVVLFRVHCRDDRVVCDSSGNAYTRVGDEKHLLSHEQVRELQVDKGQLDIEQDPTSLCFPDDFNKELVSGFISGLKRIRQPLQDHTDEDLLEHRRLGRIVSGNFQPNVACALLFAKDPLRLFPLPHLSPSSTAVAWALQIQH